MDNNEHVQSPTMLTFLDSLGLKEAITDRHAQTLGYAPTYQEGRDPIDGIFISEELLPSASGYLAFG